jgi:CTP:molybdopterin cytidylyltransferase MocA
MGSPAIARAIREAAVADDGAFLLMVSDMPLVKCIHVTMVMSWNGRFSFPILLQKSTSGAVTAPICSGVEEAKRVGEEAGLRCAAVAHYGDRYWDKDLKPTVK